jgi:hypothetical protein
MAASPSGGAPPEAFTEALRSLRAATVRPEVVVEETPAPQRLAPYAVALSADVVVDDEDLATGRLVLLHDPDGHEAWDGTFRLVTYVRADLDAEMAADPMLGAVGWSWLMEALTGRGLAHAAPSGTVTRMSSESFGAMAERPTTADMEIRASWTPVDGEVGAHLEAWSDLLCTVAGLPPVPAGVAALAPRRAPAARTRRGPTQRT